MEPLIAVGIGLFVSVIIGALILTIVWAIQTTVYQPSAGVESGRTLLIQYALWNWWSTLFSALLLIPVLVIGAVIQIASSIRANIVPIFFLSLFAIGGMLWLNYHDTLVQNYVIVSQCYLANPINFFVLPLLNIIRAIYNILMPFVNWYVNIIAALEFLPVITIFKCTTQQQLLNMLAYFLNIFYVFVLDLVAFLRSDFLYDELNVLATLDAIGLWFDALIAPVNCVCRDLGFFFLALVTFTRLQSLHEALNCLLNTVIRLLQIPLITLKATPRRPNFDNVTIEACCTLYAAGLTVEDAVFLITQAFWAVFTNSQLPPNIALVLSTDWSRIITYPLCSVVLLANMTLTAAVHYDSLTAPDGSGIAYFQFGSIVEQFRAAAEAVGELFVLFNNDAQAFVTTLLWTAIDVAGFLLEFILGSVWYYLYGGEALPLYPGLPNTVPPGLSFSAQLAALLNYLEFYPPNYWWEPLMPYNGTTYLNDFFVDALQTTQALGNLIAFLSDMDPLGALFQYALNIIIGLLEILVNLIAFTFPVLTFKNDPRTTLRQVDISPVINNLFLFAGAVGDFIRQFEVPDPTTNLTCQVSATENQNSLLCCAGNLVERVIDIIPLYLSEAVAFLVDIIVLPTGTVQFCIFFIPSVNYTYANYTQFSRDCVRIPDFSQAVFLLNEALCDFTCVVFSVIPLLGQFECFFPLPPPPAPNEVPEIPKPCGHVSTCAGNFFCQILQFLSIPLRIVNSVLQMFATGVPFAEFTSFMQFIAQQFADVAANALAAFGILVDCTLCAFTHFPAQSPNCADTVFQVLSAITILVRALPLLLTTLGLLIFKLAATLLLGLISGNPIKALIKFVVNFLIEVFGGIGNVVIKFLVGLFNAIGLAFIGSFLEILWKGFCPLLELIINIIIGILTVITLGLIPIKQANMCCNGGKCVPSGGVQKRDGDEEQQYGVIDGVLYVNVTNWIQHVTRLVQWESTNPCNTSMRAYSTREWTNMTEWEQGDAMFCLMRPYWFMRDDNQSVMGNSTCDVLMMEHNASHWFETGILERRTIMDCMSNRLFTDAFRKGINATWFPSDFLTNSMRKYVFGIELVRGFVIYWQYMSDHSKPTDTFLSPSYQDHWLSFGLNTSHYANLHTVDDILIFRQQYHLVDYFAWNKDAPQVAAVSAISIGVWAFIEQAIVSLQGTFTAMSDKTVDPGVYMTYGYSMDDNGASAAGAGLAFFATLMQGVHNMSLYWSNPENLKKRGDAMEKVKLGVWGMYLASVNQFKMMSIEYFQEKHHENELWTGQCDADEAQAFADQYDYALRHNEHSIVFRLSQWWQRAEFKTYPISHPRYPRYNTTGQSALGYHAANGQWVEETGPQRLGRFWTALNAGTPVVNRRWNSMTRLATAVKELVYVHAIKNNLEASVSYVERVYEKTVSAAAPVAPLAPQPGRASVVVQPGTLLAGPQWPRPHTTTTEVEQLHVHEQALHCGTTHPMDDGLCRDYVAPGAPPPVCIHKWQQQHRYFTPKAVEVVSEPTNLVMPMAAMPRRVLYSQMLRSGIIHVDGHLDITCYTNITFDDNTTLCEACLLVDQIVGRAQAATEIWANYFTGGQFDASINITLALFDYLWNDAATVIVGDSLTLSVGGFPGQNSPGGTWFNWGGYLGDDTPNKLRLTRFFNSSNVNVTANTTILSIFGPLDDQYINTWVIIVISSVLTTIGGTLWTYVFAGGSGTDSLGDFAVKIVEQCVLCDWLIGNNYLGTYKAFSIGEMLFLFAFGYVVLVVVVQFSVGLNIGGILALTGMSAMFLILTFLILYAGWAALCWYGLPIILADDIMYFLVYTLLCKCVWFWAHLISNPEYNNDTCYSCANTGTWHFVNCARDLGFGDIIANIVFMLESYAPQVLEWFRTSRIPPVSLFYRLPWVASRVNQFYGIDLTDPVIYRQYVGCNYIDTLLVNLYIGILFLLVVGLLYPLFTVAFSIAATMIALSFQFFFIIYLIYGDIYFSLMTSPYVESGNVDTTESSDDMPQFSAPGGTGLSSTVYGERSYRVYRQKKNRISLSMLGNILRRVYDNFFGDRKRK